MRKSHFIFCGLFFFIMGIIMTEGAQKSHFGLSDDQFWKEPTMQKPADSFGNELLWNEIKGIFIDMPATIYLDEHKSVPLAGFRSEDKEFLHEFPLSRACKLVVSNLQTGEIQAVQFSRHPDIKKPVASPGWSVQSISIDLLEHVNLGPKLGKYSARVLSGPDTSNSRIFTVYPSKGSENLSGVESQIKAARMKGGPTYPQLSLKTYDAKFPAQQQLPGDGSVWEVVAQDSNPAETRIELKYQVAGLPRFVYPKDKPHLDENGRRVYAAIPVQLLAFDEDRILIVSEKFGVPVMTKASGTLENPILEGRISLGIGQFLNKTRKPKLLSIWVISMDHFALTEIKEMK